jgi:(p)ppGpp synthase/HD superfamily hydrolase
MENPVNEERTMETERGYSERYERALRLAASAHRIQNRKAGDVPYITHPFHVSAILLRYGFPTDVAIAGLLHDVVEDQGVDLGEIEERFGGRVAGFVAALSERKQDAHGVKRPWEVRKREALEHMRQGDVEVAAIKVADALHNARSMAQDVRRDGPETWRRFNRGPEAQLGYYWRVLEIARERLRDHPMVDEFAQAIEDLAQITGLGHLPHT